PACYCGGWRNSSLGRRHERALPRDRRHRERRGSARTGRRAQDAGRLPARRRRAHGQSCRLRARRMRRVERTRRRGGGARVPDAGGAMRRRARRHHRRRGRYRRDRRSAAGVRRAQRPTVRLLHAGHVAHRAGTAGSRRRSEPRTNPHASLRQLLPLHRLSGHRRCGGGGGAGAGGGEAGGGARNRSARLRRVAAGGFEHLAARSARMKIADDSPPIVSALDRPNSYIGRSVPRPNLARLTRGRAQFVSDMTLPRMAQVAFVRSPHAHARIAAVATAGARKAPGVVAVVTGAELAKVITPWVGALTHLKGIKSAPQHAIAVERACWQGEAVCAVVARTRAEAEDACGLVEVSYEELPAGTHPHTAPAARTPVIHPPPPPHLTL